MFCLFSSLLPWQLFIVFIISLLCSHYNGWQKFILRKCSTSLQWRKIYSCHTYIILMWFIYLYYQVMNWKNYFDPIFIWSFTTFWIKYFPLSDNSPCHMIMVLKLSFYDYCTYILHLIEYILMLAIACRSLINHWYLNKCLTIQKLLNNMLESSFKNLGKAYTYSVHKKCYLLVDVHVPIVYIFNSMFLKLYYNDNLYHTFNCIWVFSVLLYSIQFFILIK